MYSLGLSLLGCSILTHTLQWYGSPGGKVELTQALNMGHTSSCVVLAHILVLVLIWLHPPPLVVLTKQLGIAHARDYRTDRNTPEHLIASWWNLRSYVPAWTGIPNHWAIHQSPPFWFKHRSFNQKSLQWKPWIDQRGLWKQDCMASCLFLQCTESHRSYIIFRRGNSNFRMCLQTQSNLAIPIKLIIGDDT